jgi:predicted MFS family arabinose efflux permease
MSVSGSPPPRVLLLATGAGLAVASLYYSHPMLPVIAAGIGTSTRAAGWIPTLTQLGYAMGILLLAPLGDRYDRRRIILLKAGALAASLGLAAVAPSLPVLLAASLAIGVVATLAQDIVPAAATLAPPAQRGKVVGTVMTGLLLGILLSRLVSGVVAETLGWRAMFLIAAASIALFAAAAWRGLPRIAPTTHLAYGALLRSLGVLWSQHPALRRAAISQGLISLAFSAFWSTLAVMLHGPPFHLGPAAAGAFGLAGALGALAAPIAGRLADRHGPEGVARRGSALVLVSFAAMAAAPVLPTGGQLVLLAICAVGFDLGVQASLIAHQTIIYSIDAAARSRLNAVLLFAVFIGMTAGAAAGSQILATLGWIGVVGLATAAALGALTVRLWPLKSRRTSGSWP